jgi:hypothetical protein
MFTHIAKYNIHSELNQKANAENENTMQLLVSGGYGRDDYSAVNTSTPVLFSNTGGTFLLPGVNFLSFRCFTGEKDGPKNRHFEGDPLLV